MAGSVPRWETLPRARKVERVPPHGSRRRARVAMIGECSNMMTQATPVRGGLTEKAKAGRDGAPRQKFFGLVELDPAGKVLYNRSETESGAPAGAAASDLTGLNFFTEVAPFRNVGEFRTR